MTTLIKAALVGLLLSAVTVGSKAQTLVLDSTTLVADTLITGLNVPWEILWGPDNYIWMTEREGKVSRVDPATGNRIVVADLRDDNGGPVYQASESGLLGMALHPDFPDSSYVFLVYTYRPASTILERMVRYEYDGDTLLNPIPYIENIPGNTTHDGSRLVVGPDRKLYMTTGDAQNQPSAQNLNSPNGKVLRFNLDGSVPSDNPFGGSYVWSWGHRNHQGLQFGPTGILYSSEHGPNNDDELNIIRGGRNFGWPTVHGYCNLSAEITFCNDSNVVEPLVSYTPTIAPGDLVYYNHPSIPEWQGTLLMTVLKEKRLIRYTLNAAGDSVTSQTIYLNNQKGRMRDICVSPDGVIYIATNGANASNTDPNTHSIIRLQNPFYVEPLVVDAGPDLSVCVGGSTQLTPTITGGAQPLTYSWTPPANLSCTVCASPLAFSINTDTEFILTVTDDQGTSITDTIVVTVVAQPDTASYVFTIIDTLNKEVSFDINAPAADSVRVVIYDTETTWDTTLYNIQNFTLTHFVFQHCSSLDPEGYCWIEYEICISAYAFCGTSTVCDTQQVITDSWIGINTINQPTFTIYPNPSSSVVTLSGLQQADKIVVMNALGAVIREINQPVMQGQDFTLILSSFEPGIYFIGVERDGALGVQKLIKQ